MPTPDPFLLTVPAVRCCVHVPLSAPAVPAKASVGVPDVAAAATVITDVAIFPSLVAVIVALPAPTAVTKPSGETEAIVESDVLQSNRRRSRSPEASLAVAESCMVAAELKVDVSDEITTEAIGRGKGGPVTLSLPTHEPMMQPAASDPMKP
jgi:hypothetical protein